jgi:hypothetical protein
MRDKKKKYNKKKKKDRNREREREKVITKRRIAQQQLRTAMDMVHTTTLNGNLARGHSYDWLRVH